MDFIKYYNFKFDENKRDCWALVQEIYKDEHNFVLPDHPIISNDKIASYLIDNIEPQIINEAKKGCIIYYHSGEVYHAGYALDNKIFIHSTKRGVRVDKIPPNAIIYKVLND